MVGTGARPDAAPPLPRRVPHVRGEPGAKSFVDDLILGRGFVRSRAAPSLRSIESQPSTQAFVASDRIGAAARRGPGAGSGGRASGFPSVHPSFLPSFRPALLVLRRGGGDGAGARAREGGRRGAATRARAGRPAGPPSPGLFLFFSRPGSLLPALRPRGRRGGGRRPSFPPGLGRRGRPGGRGAGRRGGGSPCPRVPVPVGG